MSRATSSAISCLESVILRYGMFYGPGGWDDMLELVRRRRLPIVGDGSGIWSLVHLDDAATATVAALDRGSGSYNIVAVDSIESGSWGDPELLERLKARARRITLSEGGNEKLDLKLAESF